MAKSSSISSSFQPLAMFGPAAAATSPRPRRPIGAPSSAAFLRAETTLQSFNRSPPRRGSQRGRGLMPMTSRRVVAAAASPIVPPPGGGPVPPVLPESEVPGLSQFLDTLKFDSSGMLVAIVQHIDTGELLMQAFSDRAAVSETLQTGLATFRSRSRGGRWCKGETSGHYLLVSSVHADCDGDSLVYLSRPVGPACHTGAPSCWFSVAEVARRVGGEGEDGGQGGDGGGGKAGVDGGGRGDDGGGRGGNAAVVVAARSGDRSCAPLPTLLALERTIAQRAAEAAAEAAASASSPSSKKPSWTAKLLADPELLRSKVREEADELCQAVEDDEGRDRVASEAADLLYHAAVLLNLAGVGVEDVGEVLRKRFGTSGVVEKASRKK